jgi:RNA polymerase sigma factor (sigma-70 family)
MNGIGDHAGGGFHTTRWSVVLAARGRQGGGPKSQSDEQATQALRELCSAYWQPLYSFLRRLGHEPDDAMDLTQGFLVGLLQRGHMGNPDPARGRFRTYLLGALRHYLMDQADRRQAQKRGGQAEILPLLENADEVEQSYAHYSRVSDSPERAFLRHWGLQALETARQRLRVDYLADAKAEVFDALVDQIGGPPNPLPMAERAPCIGMTTDALKMALTRLRRRYGDTLRKLIAETVDSPDEVDAEIRYLIEALG